MTPTNSLWVVGMHTLQRYNEEIHDSEFILLIYCLVYDKIREGRLYN